MARLSAPAKVGAFTVVTLVAGGFLFRFVSERAGDRGGYQVYCLLNDASGIASQSQVRMAGIPVGTVKSIRLEGNKARVDIVMSREVPLFEDAAAKKVSSSLLGEFHLAIAGGTDGRRKLGEGDRIRTVEEAASTDQILKDVADITQDVKKVAESLAKSVGTGRGEENIRVTLDNVAEITKNLNAIVKENRESLRSILANVDAMTKRGAPQVDEILENVRVTTKEIREVLAATKDVNGETGADEVREIISKVNRASDSLEKSLSNLEVVSGRLEKGEGTLGRLSKDDKLINDVEGITEGVGEFVDGVRRIETHVGLRTDYQFLTSSVKSYVDVRIQPREDKYYLIEVVNDPRGYTHYEQIDVDTTNPNDPPHYREVRTITENKLRFSLQFAQSFGPFTGRFGLIESTGGVGLDLTLFQKRFELRQDLFGFGELVMPRYRATLGYEFLNRLWLLGGIDDVFSSDRRDYFVGLQLRFNDEDLKRVLPFAPSM